MICERRSALKFALILRKAYYYESWQSIETTKTTTTIPLELKCNRNEQHGASKRILKAVPILVTLSFILECKMQTSNSMRHFTSSLGYFPIT